MMYIYIYINILNIYIYMYGAHLRTCCRIGGWNHHSGHRAMIVCDNCTQRSAIVFLTPGQLAGHMRRSTCIRRNSFPTPNLDPKTGSISGPTICSLAFWGLVFLHHQRVYLLKVSLRNHNHMRSTQLLPLQAYTHTQCTAKNMLQNRRLKSP